MTTPVAAHHGRLTVASDPPPPDPAATDAGDPASATEPGLGAPDDAMSQMYVAMSNAQQADVAAGTGQVTVDQNTLRQARAAQQAAMAQAQANQSDSGGGFLGSIEKFVGNLVSDVAQGKFGSAVDDAERNVAAAWNSPKFWNDLETAATDVATVGEVAEEIPPLEAVATTVTVSAMVVKAVARVRTSEFAATVQDATADATGAANHARDVQTEEKDLLSEIQDTVSSHQQALQSIAQAINTNDQTLVAAASMHVQG